MENYTIWSIWIRMSRDREREVCMIRQTKVVLATLLVALSAPALAGLPNTAVVVPHAIPAVGQAGLIALAFAVGIIGAVLIRKHKPQKH